MDRLTKYDQVEQLEGVASRLSSTECGLDTVGICGKCSNATVIRRLSRSGLSVFCDDMREYVPDDVAECSAFTPRKRQLTMTEMVELHIPIDTRVGVNDKSYI